MTNKSNILLRPFLSPIKHGCANLSNKFKLNKDLTSVYIYKAMILNLHQIDTVNEVYSLYIKKESMETKLFVSFLRINNDNLGDKKGFVTFSSNLHC